MWGKAKELLADFAPALADALGGRFGGIALSALMDALDITNPEPAELAEAVEKMTPEQKIAVQAQELKFLTDSDSMYTKRFIAVQNADVANGSTRWGWISLAGKGLVFAVFLGLFVFMAVTAHQDKNEKLETQVWGLLQIAVGGIIGYATGQKSKS